MPNVAYTADKETKNALPRFCIFDIMGTTRTPMFERTLFWLAWRPRTFNTHLESPLSMGLLMYALKTNLPKYTPISAILKLYKCPAVDI